MKLCYQNKVCLNILITDILKFINKNDTYPGKKL